MSGEECVCGAWATVRVRVEWADGAHVYLFCAECADDMEQFLEGVEILR